MTFSLRRGRAVRLSACAPAAGRCQRTSRGQPSLRNEHIRWTRIAEEYVKLVLAVGPARPRLRGCILRSAGVEDEAASRQARGLRPIAAERALISAAELKAARPNRRTRWRAFGCTYLQRQLSALAARVRMLNGERLSFDEESKALYDAVAPTQPESHSRRSSTALEKRFPGSGPLVERYDAYRRAFVIPRDGSTRCSRARSRHARSARAST